MGLPCNNPESCAKEQYASRAMKRILIKVKTGKPFEGNLDDEFRKYEQQSEVRQRTEWPS